jgi:hypothetical protein
MLVFLIVPLQVASGNLFVLANNDPSPYALLNLSVQFLTFLRQQIAPLAVPVFAGISVACTCLRLPEKRRRLLIDVMYGFVALRLVLLFLILNLMIFFPPSDRVLLFAQLLLFVPCLLLTWGWIYWRVDSYFVAAGEGRIFSSSTSGDEIPPASDYFMASFTSLPTKTLDNFNAKTRFGRSLIYMHGIMIWDIMGLALSRAIALAAA